MNRVNLACLGFGTAFGFLFSAAQFNQYDVIHQMLRLHDPAPFLVMGSAVLTALPLLWLLERRKARTLVGAPLQLRRWPVERKLVYGGAIFGAGWAVTGACPGTVAAMVAAGNVLGIVPLVGILGGILLRDVLNERQVAQPRPQSSAVVLQSHS